MHSVIGDIRDREKLINTMQEAQPEIVLHLAAQPIVRESYKDPVGTYETNVMGTVNILEAVRQTKSVKSFLNVTTDKSIKITNGSGATGKPMNWTGTIRIPTVSPVPNW